MAGVGLVERGAERGMYLAAALGAGLLAAAGLAVLAAAVGGVPHALSQHAGRLAGGVGGTALVAVIAGGLAFPVGVLAATWLRWFAPEAVARPGRVAVRLVRAVPAVVWAFAGVVVVAPAIGAVAGVDGRGGLAAVAVLTVVVVPVVVAASDRVLQRVPDRRLEVVLALGGTREQAVRRAVWPAVATPLVGAGVLGASRAVADTLVVLLVAAPAGAEVLGPLHTLTTLAVGSQRPAALVAGALLLVAGGALGAVGRRLERAP